MSITGNLRTLEFAELLQWLAQGQKTGALVINNGKVEKRIYFQEGKIICSESNNPAEHLGTFMVREGLLDEATLARAVKLQESTQILLGKVLVTLGTLSEDELHRTLRRKTEESLYELFNWTAGDFKFLPGDLPKLPMVPLEIDVTNVVLEGAKRFDEARRDARAGTGDYGAEIEEVLSSEIFQGVDFSEAEPLPGTTESLAMREDNFETEVEEESPAEVRGYYSGSARAVGKTPMLAAAAAIAAIAIGITAYVFMRPDPAAGTADRASLESSLPADSPDPLDDMEDLYLPPDSELEEADAGLTEDGAGEPIAEPAQPDESEQMRARYESELAALKQQLAQAQVVAAERDAAMGRVAELEEQVAQAQESEEAYDAVLEPEPQFVMARLQDPVEESTISAGGDEPPPLGPPTPATEADHEAGTDFATEMVELAPSPVLNDLTSAPPVPEEVEAAEIDEPGPEISSPVLLSRPKPRFPAAAMRLGKEAVITLRLLVGTDGKVVDVERVGDEAGMGFDKAAINAALGTRWQPATRDGEPVEMWTEMRIAFKP